ncbi:MAG: bifunctional serine/threonine-protein kinase/formylglycine-generating enzyme family protein [Ardenticatenaceae bacterium]
MLRPNTTLQHGRYRIIREIGRGGMGAVYEAYDNNLSSRVALKEALVSDADLLRAFEREAQRLDRLRHAALPTVKDHFIEGGGQYLVMEFIDGQDLRQMLKQRGRPFPVRNVLEWADRLLDALIYLHSRNPPLIHRDIKPGNLKLTPDGHIILLDFGLAKGGLTQRTLTGQTLFGYTLDYAPPEQIQGLLTDERSDLYTLGATVYALLTGEAPDDATLRQKYINDRYPDPLKPVNQLNPRVPPHVAQAIQRAMALDPGQRPANAAQMRALLKAPPAKAPPSSSSAGASGQATLPTQTTDPSPPRANPEGEGQATGAGTEGADRQAWLLRGAMIAAVLLFGVLVGTYMSGRGDREPQVVREIIAAGATAVAQKDGMVQVHVPAGEFEMGSAENDPDANDDEKPRHTVYLDAFWIDRTEVTNAMFANFVQQTGHQSDAEKEGWGWALYGSWEKIDGTDWQHPLGPESDLDGLDDHPVVQVSWNDATAYCEWAERRLPTEAEWEKAAGGTEAIVAERRKWPWGNEVPTGERLNFCDQNCLLGYKDSSTDDGYEFTSPVGNYPAGASPYGALDMAGNVWEWIFDEYSSSYYESSPPENPQGPWGYGRKALRGGSWIFSAPVTRVRYRWGSDARYRDGHRGFRCARSP